MFALRRKPFICQLCAHSRRYYASAAKKPSSTKAAPDVSIKSRKTKKATSLSQYSSDKPFMEPAARKNRIEAFLDELDTTPEPPTLDDLFNFKPAPPVGPGSENYAEAYDTAVKKISRAFNNQQLIEFLNSSKFNEKPPSTKRELVRVLLEKSWDWAPPHEVGKKVKGEEEKIARAIPVSRASLFLLLGEDGHNLQTLAYIHNVESSIATEGGTFIEVTGVEKDILAFAHQVAIHESRIITDTIPSDNGISLPFQILSKMSQLCGAFIDPSPMNRSLEISAFTQEAIEKTKRTMERYIQRRRNESQIPLIAEVPFDIEGEAINDHPEYALYPYRPPKAVPWMLQKQGLFRVKRVTDLGKEDQAFGSEERFLDFDDVSKIKLNTLLQATKTEDGYERSWIARTGHTAFISDRSGIVPPIPGKWPVQRLTAPNEETNIESYFFPSVPSVIQDSSPAVVGTVHRVIYRQRLEDESTTPRFQRGISHTPIFLVEVMMKHTESAPELDDLDAQDTGGESVTLHALKAPTRCQEGFEGTVDTILPDRAMEFRLIARDLRPIAEEDEPKAIRDYLDDLLAFLNFARDDQPLAPTTIFHNGISYVLESSSSIRRAEEVLTLQAQDWELHSPGDPTDVLVACESSLDLESKEKSFECIVEATQCATTDDWDRFMAQCQTVTTMPFTSMSQKEPEIRFTE